MDKEKKYTQADLDFFSANADEYLEMVIKLKKELEWLVDTHHRTISGSKLHDPEHILDFKKCPCLTCKRVTKVLNG